MTIVGDESVRQPVPIDDRFSEKVLGLLFSDVRQRLSFYPLGEVADGDNKEFLLAGCWGEWTQNVHPPLGKRP